MPRMPKTKIELKNTLPSDPVERDRLKKSSWKVLKLAS